MKSKKNKLKCAVIGGAGFIGSSVAKELYNFGYKVKIIDLVKNEFFKKDSVICDIKNFNLLKKHLNKIDYVFNFSGIADIGYSNKFPQKTINENIIGSSNVFQACAELKVKRVFFASTLYVYSSSGGFYKSTKQALENILEAYSSNYNLKFTILRYGSVYGVGAQDWNGLNKYIIQAIKKNKIEYFGNGEEIREYINVTDAAKLTLQTISKEYENSYVTVSGVNSIKAKDLFIMIQEILQKKLKINYFNLKRKSEHYLTTPYNFTPRRSIKIIPRQYLDLGEGLLEIVSDFHKNKKN